MRPRLSPPRNVSAAPEDGAALLIGKTGRLEIGRGAPAHRGSAAKLLSDDQTALYADKGRLFCRGTFRPCTGLWRFAA